MICTYWWSSLTHTLLFNSYHIINHSSANFAAALLPSMMILPSWKIPCSLRRRVLLTLCLRTKVAVQVMDGRVTLGMIMICTCTRHFMIAKRNALMLEACVMDTSMTIGVINARCGRSSLINTGWNTFMAWTATSKPPTSKQWSWKNRRRWLYSSDDLLSYIENVLVWIDRDVRDKLGNLLAKIIFLEGMVSLSLSIAKDVSSITWGFAHDVHTRSKDFIHHSRPRCWRSLLINKSLRYSVHSCQLLIPNIAQITASSDVCRCATSSMVM